MQLKTRLLKLERTAQRKASCVCVIIKLDEELTLAQRRQLDKAKAEKRQIIMVSFVDDVKVWRC